MTTSIRAGAPAVAATPLRCLVWACLALLCSPSLAQTVFAPTVDLDFDDPEAWAMKFFTSVSLQTSLGPVLELPAGEVSLGLELLSVPHLDREQRTVGFGGFKEEDLNRSAIWARIRAQVGLPAGWGLVLGWAPPVELDGVEADLWSLAVKKSLWSGESWSFGLRLYGQTGQASGDLTCSQGGDERFEPGSADNPFGCEAPSTDEIQMDYYGLELVAAYALAGSGGGAAPTLHAGLSLSHLDMEFQVDALTFGFRDRSLLRADGDTLAATCGATWRLGSRSRLGAELFYSPLDVKRTGQARKSDDLVNLRLLWSWRVR